MELVTFDSQFTTCSDQIFLHEGLTELSVNHTGWMMDRGNHTY
jgi:hypothetical protein